MDEQNGKCLLLQESERRRDESWKKKNEKDEEGIFSCGELCPNESAAQRVHIELNLGRTQERSLEMTIRCSSAFPRRTSFKDEKL
ncbi:hypothetical protein BLNAU_7838 [Blattamonas nauphoetae]|uniref:Uncharacterized protein n=1 Tax=Blattamonas nauphoetae TaxID=2049346 RepID=A0ABQ9Y0L6_9EUKA|nr:hypothetical protein BLNAU_7838 [Blattamonas nauphoetae]